MNNEEKILALLAAMQADIADVKTTQAAQGEQLAKQGEQLAKHGEQLASLADKVDSMEKRLTTVTGRLEIVDDQLGRVAIAQEQDIIPYIKLLDEGHQEIMRKLADKERVDVLEKDMRLVKASVKNHAQRIAALEKAN